MKLRVFMYGHVYGLHLYIHQHSGRNRTLSRFSSQLTFFTTVSRRLLNRAAVRVMYGSKKLQGFKKPETNVQNFTFQAATTLQGGWGLTSVGPRTHLRNPIRQKSMCARFIGNSNLDPVKPYVTYSAHCILK